MSSEKDTDMLLGNDVWWCGVS